MEAAAVRVGQYSCASAGLPFAAPRQEVAASASAVSSAPSPPRPAFLPNLSLPLSVCPFRIAGRARRRGLGPPASASRLGGCALPPCSSSFSWQVRLLGRPRRGSQRGDSGDFVCLLGVFSLFHALSFRLSPFAATAATIMAIRVGKMSFQDRILQQASARGWQQTFASVTGLGLTGSDAGDSSDASRRRADESASALSQGNVSVAPAAQEAEAQVQTEERTQTEAQEQQDTLQPMQGQGLTEAQALPQAEARLQDSALAQPGAASAGAQAAGAVQPESKTEPVAAAVVDAPATQSVATEQEAQQIAAGQGVQPDAALGASSGAEGVRSADAGATASEPADGGTHEEPSDVVTAAEAAVAQAAAANAAAAIAATDVAVGGEDDSAEASSGDQAASADAAATAIATSAEASDLVAATREAAGVAGEQAGEGKPDDWWVPAEGGAKVEFDLSSPVRASKVIDELLKSQEPVPEYPDTCSIYVLDAALEIWPALGISAACNLADPEVRKGRWGEAVRRRGEATSSRKRRCRKVKR